MDEPKLHMWETGVMRITRHPQALGQALWCAAHTAWIGSSFMVATSAALMAHHVFGCWHGDFRLRRKYGAVRPALASASMVASVRGHAANAVRQSLARGLRENVEGVCFSWQHSNDVRMGEVGQGVLLPRSLGETKGQEGLAWAGSGASALAPDNKATPCCADKVAFMLVCTSEQPQQQACGCMRQAFDAVAARTSTLPFQAIWEGRQVEPLVACKQSRCGLAELACHLC